MRWCGSCGSSWRGSVEGGRRGDGGCWGMWTVKRGFCWRSYFFPKSRQNIGGCRDQDARRDANGCGE